ncbi:hypothetical protein [Streptomyces chryseus]
MSTAVQAPAATRIPNPGDVARRYAARRLAKMLAPGKLAPGEAFRPLFERGVLGSHMTPPSRLVALVLATHADPVTGIIAEETQPSLNGLASATGLKRRQVTVATRALMSRGWVTDHSAPVQYADDDPGRLQLHIPAHVLALLRR